MTEIRSVSFLLSAHNERFHIAKTIASIAFAKIEPAIEKHIVVCANACTDGTEETIIGVEKMVSANCSLDMIIEPKRGKPNAINRLIEFASSSRFRDCDTFALMDADVFLNGPAFGTLLSTLHDSDYVKAVSGRITPSDKRLSFIETLSDIPHKVTPFGFLRGGLILMKREALCEIYPIPQHVITDDVWISAKLGYDHICRINDTAVLYHPAKYLVDILNQSVRQWQGVLQARRIFGNAEIEQLVPDSIMRAFNHALNVWPSLSRTERLAVVAAVPTYSVVKLIAMIKRFPENGWERITSTKY